MSSILLLAEVGVAESFPYKQISFKVFDLRNDQEISRGKEIVTRTGNTITKTTEYWRENDPGQILQRESCSFDFETLVPSEYHFNNVMTGEDAQLFKDDGLLKVKYREKTGAKEQQKSVAWVSDMMIGKTLTHFIVRNWETIRQGEPKVFSLFLPMKLDYYKFRVIRRGAGEPKENEAYVIELELNNWALRQFAPPMEFYYQNVNGLPMVTQYVGATTIAVDGDKDKKVRIEFHYDS